MSSCCQIAFIGIYLYSRADKFFKCMHVNIFQAFRDHGLLMLCLAGQGMSWVELIYKNISYIINIIYWILYSIRMLYIIYHILYTIFYILHTEYYGIYIIDYIYQLKLWETQISTYKDECWKIILHFVYYILYYGYE